MIKILLTMLLTFSLYAENNDTIKAKTVAEQNTTKEQSSKTKSEKEKRVEEQVREQMEKEKKYAKEQRFYTADEYNFKDAEVDPKSLDKIEALEPDYDFDMDTGVYDD